jgi:hypothetical protein
MVSENTIFHSKNLIKFRLYPHCSLRQKRQSMAPNPRYSRKKRATRTEIGSRSSSLSVSAICRLGHWTSMLLSGAEESLSFSLVS